MPVILKKSRPRRRTALFYFALLFFSKREARSFRLHRAVFTFFLFLYKGPSQRSRFALLTVFFSLLSLPNLLFLLRI